MIAEIRGAFFLVICLVFFLIIIGVLALGTFMRSDRWIERARHAG